jgi:peptidoglycan/LPS O-acetylase OafA/YrhL
MVFHQTLLSGSGAANAFDRWFFDLAKVGWCGVDLFFVLSGYLITGILWDARNSEGYFRNFYARRTLRIFPLYYAVVFFALVVLPNLPAGVVPPEKVVSLGRLEASDEIWYWLYLSNFSIAAAGAWRHGILDISWSLAIEEQFYLVWPAVVFLLSRTALLRLCLAMIVGALALRVGLALADTIWISAYVLTPARMDVLAVGAFVALASRGPGGIDGLRPGSRAFGLGAGLLLAAWFLWAGSLNVRDPLVRTFGFTLVALAFGGLLVEVLCVRSGSALHRFFTHRALRELGKYSYALYLFHLPLRALLRDTVYGSDDFPIVLGSQVPGQLLFYAAASSLAFAAAFASWNLYEKRFLALKRYFPTRRR